ncbi:DUF6327 family protein [Flavobacterium psychrotolerans]|uniref:Uncharacterized protein n=1 Tax=Flavobacterium psychrotolerans TaxID=2169410 RepID=A0A2U1JP33_9FLAO|nr:DUF6327 family protein [Flavobacterium psychrotolerans]PWA06936.1 hypothetical protein DB895_02855 [Flavobacterium psychrotolerans]
MATKKYSSYAQINNELEILKLEKEIHYRKIINSVQKTKDSFAPKNIVTDLISSSNSMLTGPYGVVLKMATPFILNKAIPFFKKWVSKKKRGN